MRAVHAQEVGRKFGVEFVEHPSSKSRLGTTGSQFSETFARVVASMRTHVITTMVQSDVTLRNLLMNVDHYVTGGGVQDLLNAAAGFPADALQMGFVSKVGSGDEFEKIVDDWCAKVAENAPLTLRALKATVNELIRDPDERDMAKAEAAIAACMASDDYREGALAFMEKRAPVFRGV